MGDNIKKNHKSTSWDSSLYPQGFKGATGVITHATDKTYSIVWTNETRRSSMHNKGFIETYYKLDLQQQRRGILKGLLDV